MSSEEDELRSAVDAWDRDDPNWDRDGRVAAAEASLGRGLPLDRVVAIHGPDIASEALVASVMRK